MSFPSRLKKIRTQRKLTQEQLGSKVNVTKVSISGYESGNRTPDMETLQKIADVLDVSIDYLLARTNDSTIVLQEELTSEENIFFKEYEKLSNEDKQKALEHIKFLKHLAGQENEN
jgi:transcriptional regulator with XRE-family HTH domain